jgi:ABC-type multidrug transport system ATPase subunit
MPVDGGRLEVEGKRVPAFYRSEVLFYIPDGISPWEQQRVEWLLNFFEGIYSNSQMRCAELTGPLKLEPLMKARISSLSKGERKRVLLAAGLLTPHRLLMLDEPFDGLDLRQTRDVMVLLREHAARGRTLMLSIHQLQDAGRVCDRLVLLSDGRVVGEGTIAELQDQAGLKEGGVEEIFLALT